MHVLRLSGVRAFLRRLPVSVSFLWRTMYALLLRR